MRVSYFHHEQGTSCYVGFISFPADSKMSLPVAFLAVSKVVFFFFLKMRVDIETATCVAVF